MPSFNKVIIVGNLTRDPEIRNTTKGTAMGTIGLAVNRKFKDSSGAEREEVAFIDVNVFGRQAEVLAQYSKKGNPLLVEGRLKTDSWVDKTTQQKRYKLVVVLESFQFISSGERRATEPATKEPEGSAPAVAETTDDDVPF